MPLLGKAALAMWWDIAPGVLADFQDVTVAMSGAERRTAGGDVRTSPATPPRRR